ncbi:MAG: cytochrome c biogenesis protein CcdA [Patescibacteria group bacterium]
MTLLAISFFAGILTVLAPCILPLLPVVVGSSASGRSRSTPYIVVGSLAISIILFTYLLKASTAFIMVPPEVWTYLSGGILLLFGLTLLFPGLWERLPGINKLSAGSNKLLGEGYQKKSFWGDVIVGASLGPIFSTCSPTYFVILASVLPASFLLGTAYLLSYTLGLSLILLFIALLGERFASRLSGFSDPQSKFKRSIGALFIVLGLLIALGYEKKLETAILDSGFLDITKLENKLLNRLDMPEESYLPDTGSEVISEELVASSPETTSPAKPVPKVKGVPYKEIVKPAGFVNTNDLPIKLSDYVGKSVILLDVMTYSCINCQRTFPYLVSWYEKYKDDGFIIVGIHTPEFAFEKDKENVEKAMKEFGITFPIVLDNDFGTWNAYGNRYWPRKYLIDIYGNIVYDHIGEGAYEEIEMKIKELLKERVKVLGEGEMPTNGELVSKTISPQVTTSQSPETYFGSLRNEYLRNGMVGRTGEQTLTVPAQISLNGLYLGGTWNFNGEYAKSVKNSKVVYRYNAKEVYIVASADSALEMEVWQDGKLVTAEAGADVVNGTVTIKESKLYKLIKNITPGEHTLELRAEDGILLFAFTFG